MTAVLVTGANGFVGKRLCGILAESGHLVRAAVRSGKFPQNTHPNIEFVSIGDISSEEDWTLALKGIEVIVHLAARVHVMKESVDDPLAEYRRINVDGTLHLALMAAGSGVKRLVYVSTIKVNGEETREKPFHEDDVPSPQDAYSISKWEAEEALHYISSQSSLEIVIIRPPLVYGPGVKGNLLTLMRYVDRGYPMPFGAINNKRSLISLDNFADVLLKSATKAECAGKTFLVSDGEDLSTAELITRIADAMDRKPHLISIPEKALGTMGAMFPALRPIIGRLTASLVVDSTLFARVVGWSPPQTVNAGMKAMVSAYLFNK